MNKQAVINISTLLDAIGILASDCALFHQDPRDCDRQVIYRKPHRMSFGPSPITYTQAVATHDTSPPEIEEFSGSLDPFHDPKLAKDLPETEAAKILKTRLYPQVSLHVWRPTLISISCNL